MMQYIHFMVSGVARDVMPITSNLSGPKVGVND